MILDLSVFNMEAGGASNTTTGTEGVTAASTGGASQSESQGGDQLRKQRQFEKDSLIVHDWDSSKTAGEWEYCKPCSVKDEVANDEIKMTETLKRAQNASYHVCILCLKDENAPLKKAIFRVINGQTRNATSHLRHHHRTIWEEVESNKEFSDKGPASISHMQEDSIEVPPTVEGAQQQVEETETSSRPPQASIRRTPKKSKAKPKRPKFKASRNKRKS
jgi:hypothetical protein